MRKRFGKCMAMLLVSIALLQNDIGNYQCVKAAAQKVKTKAISLNCKKKTISVGDKYKLTVKKVKPTKASKKVTWKSSNKKIVSVSKSGTIMGKKKGKATVVAISKTNKKVKAVCEVTVKQKIFTMSTTEVKKTTEVPTTKTTVEVENTEITTEVSTTEQSTAEMVTSKEVAFKGDCIDLYKIGSLSTDKDMDDENKIIRNKEELEQLILAYEKNSTVGSATAAIVEKLKMYDEEYFEKNVLCYTRKLENSPYGNVEILKVAKEQNADGKIVANVYTKTTFVRNPNYYYETICGDYSYFVEVAKEDMKGVTNVDFIVEYATIYKE